MASHAILIGLFGLGPLLFSTQLNDPQRLPQLLGMQILLLIAVVLGIRSKAADAPVKVALPLLVMVMLWAVLHVLSLLSASNVPEAVFETVQTFSMIGLFLVLLQQFRGADTWETLAKIAVVAAVLQAGLGLLQMAGLDPWGMTMGKFPIGTHGNPNHLASAMVLLLPLLIYAAIRLPRAWKVAGLLAACMTLVVMYRTESRAAWMTVFLWAVITSVWFLPMLWRSLDLRRWFWHGLVAGLVLVVAGLAVFRMVGKKKEGSYHFEYLWDDQVAIRPEHNSLEFRFILWNRSMDMIADQPLTGVGAGNWKVEVPGYGVKGFDDEQRYGMDFVMRAHNDFLEAGAELGVLGMLCLLGLFGAGFWMSGGQGRDREKGFLLLLAFSGMLVDASFGFPQERVFQSMMFWTYLALAAGKWQEGRARGRMLPGWWRHALALALVMGMIVVGFRIKGDADMHRMLVAKSRKNWPLVEKEAARATNWAISIDPVSATPAAWYEGMAQLSTGRNAAGLASMQRASEVAPLNLAVRTNLAAAYEMNGNHRLAAKEYESLLEVFPDFEESWLNLAVVRLHLGEFGKVREALGKVGSFRSDPRYQAIQAELDRVSH